jgi:hypothetical protein
MQRFGDGVEQVSRMRASSSRSVSVFRLAGVALDLGQPARGLMSRSTRLAARNGQAGNALTDVTVVFSSRISS